MQLFVVHLQHLVQDFSSIRLDYTLHGIRVVKRHLDVEKALYKIYQTFQTLISWHPFRDGNICLGWVLT